MKLDFTAKISKIATYFWNQRTGTIGNGADYVRTRSKMIVLSAVGKTTFEKLFIESHGECLIALGGNRSLPLAVCNEPN